MWSIDKSEAVFLSGRSSEVNAPHETIAVLRLHAGARFNGENYSVAAILTKKRSPKRRRNLLRLDANKEVHLASRSRKGYWRMSRNSIVQAAITNEWLETQGKPNLQTQWTAYPYPPKPTVQGQ